MSPAVSRPFRCGWKPHLRPLTPIPLPGVVQQCVRLSNSDLGLVHANLSLGHLRLPFGLEPRHVRRSPLSANRRGSPADTRWREHWLGRVCM